MIGELAALGATLSWVVSGVLYRKALLSVNALQANIIRLTSTSILWVAFLMVTRKLGILLDLPHLVVTISFLSGVIGLVLGDTLYMLSLKLVGVARAIPSACIYPLFNILNAALLKGEDITISMVLGALCIIAGIWLISQQERHSSDMLSRMVLVKGVASGVSASVMYAVSITLMNVAVTTSEIKSSDGALAVNTMRILSALIIMLALCPIFDRRCAFLKAPKQTWFVLSAGGLAGLGLAWFFLTFSFLYTQEARAVPISSTTPLFSGIAGVVFFHEPLTKKILFGSTIIVLGIFLLFI